jgi:hypothetical protein
MAEPKVLLFVDNSNIFISAKNVAHTREGRQAKDSVRISFDNLLILALAGRKLEKAYVVGSIPPEQRSVWDRLEQATGVKPELFERGQCSGIEQGIDQCLQVHMLRAISDISEPQVVVLMTGDGAGYDDGVGFHADMARMHAAGWGIEVVTWDSSCKRSLRQWAKASGCFIRMEDYYDSITFIEGGRRAKPINLAGRPFSRPRPNPAKLAEQKAKADYEKKLAEMQAELEAAKIKKRVKEQRKSKYDKRMSRHKK